MPPVLDLANLPDADVVALAQQGRETAYRELLRRYERPVFALVFRMVRDRELAEDLTQDTFVKVLSHVDKYRPEFKFSSWLFKIANNVAIDHLRRRTLDTISMDGSPHAGTIEAVEAKPTAAESPKMTEDPIRMYLSQMAEIPLLSRTEEISLAKKIEITRKRFRRLLMECDFSIRIAVDELCSLLIEHAPPGARLHLTLCGETISHHLEERADARVEVLRAPRQVEERTDAGLRERGLQREGIAATLLDSRSRTPMIEADRWTAFAFLFHDHDWEEMLLPWALRQPHREGSWMLSLGIEVEGETLDLVPLLADEYMLRAIIIPFVILSLAALGVNILVGYCGQISIGSGAFMAVGAYAAYNCLIRIDGIGVIAAILLGGLFATLVGIAFGSPSLRVRGLYLAVATLAAQFFWDWAFLRVPWFTNYSPSGSVQVSNLTTMGWRVDTPMEKYLLCLAIVCVFALLAKNLVRSAIGREWMAIRDMDVAAAVIGIRPLYAKLSAFAVSSFILGVAGALWGFVYLGAWEPAAFSVDRSFQLLFMVIIGGLGSIMGSFFGAAFIVVLPIFLNQALPALGSLVGVQISTAGISHTEFMIFGALIVWFLIVEPHGLARLWSVGKQKLRLWPFPH